MVRALRLLSNVAQTAGDDRRRLVADIETVSYFNWLHQPQMAEVRIAATDAWLSLADNMADTCPRHYAEFLVVKAETLLLSKKVTSVAFVLHFLPPAVLALQPPQSGTHYSLASVVLPLQTLSVTFLKLAASSRPTAPPSGSAKCLRFGH